MSKPRFGRSLKPFRYPLLWSGLWCVAIAVLIIGSLLPAQDVPMPKLHNGDKLLHFAGYFVLSAMAVQLFRNWPALLGAGIGLVLLGIGVEYAQGALTADRMADARDALANTLGVIVGLGTRLLPWRDALLRLDGGHQS